jgi:hypothetical protein
VSDVVTVGLAVGDALEQVRAERCAAAGLSGILCVHPRRAEPRQAATILCGWTVTHIASGYAVAQGYTKQDAIREAAARIRRVGRAKFLRLAAAAARDHVEVVA